MGHSVGPFLSATLVGHFGGPFLWALLVANFSETFWVSQISHLSLIGQASRMNNMI